jgi:hypothetical protein
MKKKGIQNGTQLHETGKEELEKLKMSIN